VVQVIGRQFLKCWKLNELAFEDILLSIDYSTSSGKTAFNLVYNCGKLQTIQMAIAS
jgi:hypothetical protein